MNLHTAAAYANHLLKARSTAGHGVHSPFMFRFITEVIGGRTDRAIITEVESLRKEMLSDRRVVQVRDLGAGSAVIRGVGSSPGQDAEVGDREQNLLLTESHHGEDQVARKAESHHGEEQVIRKAESHHEEEQVIRKAESHHEEEQVIRQAESQNREEHATRQDAPVQDRGRRIREIAAVAAVPKREAALLARIAGSLDKIRSGGAEAGGISGEESEAVILELGTSLGISTLALALGAPHRKVISVEGCPELSAIARENLLRHGAQNAEVLCMEFSEALDSLKNRGVKVVLAYIDGNHRGAALKEYVNLIREMGEEMILIADDIHMNREMICAWRSIAEGTTAQVSGAGTEVQTTDRETAPASGAGPGKQTTSRETAPASGAGPAVQHATGKITAASLETFRMGMLFCLRNLTPGRYLVR